MRNLHLLKLIILLSVLFSKQAMAEQLQLQCVTSSGHRAENVTIDLKEKVFHWGKVSQYDIINIDKKYITAYEKPRGIPGGEVWVFERKTGEYTRAVIGQMIDYWDHPSALELRGRIHRGRCSRGDPLKRPVEGINEF